MDRDLPDNVMLDNPELYSLGRKNQLFTLRKFVMWQANAVFVSLVCFFVPLYCSRLTAVDNRGRVFGLFETGIVSFISLVFVVSFRLILEAKWWTLLYHIVTWVSIVFTYIWLLVLQYIRTLSPNYYYIFNDVFMNKRQWFLVLVCAVLGILPNLVYEQTQRQLHPKDVQILREIHFLGRRNPKKMKHFMLSAPGTKELK